MNSKVKSCDYEVVKMGYSSRPWRIVERDCQAGDQCRRPLGCRVCEVYVDEPFDHPNLGRTVIAGPLAFDRKRDAVAALAAMEAVGHWLAVEFELRRVLDDDEACDATGALKDAGFEIIAPQHLRSAAFVREAA